MPTELSGGQQQRVAIARAIVADPTLLVCDEPTGDLDRQSADEVLSLLQALNREHGKTIVMVTHDPKAAEYASQTLHLDKGTLVESAAAVRPRPRDELPAPGLGVAVQEKTRTFLTLLSIIAAFLLFGLLDAVQTSFNQAGQSANGARRLQTGAKLSFIQPLPAFARSADRGGAGGQRVTYANWFGGAYQDPHNQVFSFAVAPGYLDLFPEVSVTEAERKAFAGTRTGALVGAQLAQRFKWKVGDKIPMQSTIYPDKSGSKNWSFDVVGILHATDKRPEASSTRCCCCTGSTSTRPRPTTAAPSAGT